MSDEDDKPVKKAKVQIITPVFRGSYAQLVKPRAIEEGKEPQYSILIVLPKKSKESITFIKKLEVELLKCYREKHGKPGSPKTIKYWPIQDGDTKEDEAFHGNWLIRASNTWRPGCIDRNNVPLDKEADLYSGAWYKVGISPWGWSNPKSGKGVSVNLNGVLKWKDDEQFTSRAKVDEMFAADLEGGAEDEEVTEDDDLLN